MILSQVYVPTIAREILADPGPLSLKGFAVGDGCMGGYSTTSTRIYLLLTRGLRLPPSPAPPQHTLPCVDIAVSCDGMHAGTEVLCGSGNPDKGPYYRVEFMHGHGQVSERNYRAIMQECPEQALKTGQGSSATLCYLAA
jgi:hypothetical protein